MTRPAWHDAALASALARTPLVARRIAGGSSEGRHPSRLPGIGMEFAQYRGYQPGDDLRRVDWKLLARSDRFFVRESDAETALPIRFLLDASGSMAHEEGGVRKFDTARAIVAALAEVVVRQGDVPSLGIVGTADHVVASSRDRRQLERIIDALDRSEPRGALRADVTSVIAAQGGGPHGIVVVVTDWHDPDHALQLSLERTGLDAIIIVLRTPREQDLQYGRPVMLEDLESGQRLLVDGAADDRRARLLATRIDSARRSGIDVVQVDPLAPLDEPLKAWLVARAGSW